MNFWESLIIHTYKHQGVLIEEQNVNYFNPIYALDSVTGLYQDHATELDLYSRLIFHPTFTQESLQTG